MSGQSRAWSVVESIANIAVGFCVSVLIGWVAYPLCGIDVSLEQNFAVTAIFTVASLVRSYLLRRLFNART